VSSPGGPLLLGVDGGNSKTVALVARADGTIVGAGRSGNTDIYNASSVEAALEELGRAVATALAAAGGRAEDVVGSAFSLAGADWPEDFALLGRELPQRIGLDHPPVVVNDAIGALRCSTDDAVGVAVVCGTGGAIGARNRRGETFHVGFWPDSMGGEEIAQAGLAAVFRAGLDLGPQTSLIERALRRYGAGSEMELLHTFTRRDRPRPRRAAFVADVLDAGDAGDPVAVEIVTGNGHRLGEAARISAARVGLEGGYALVLAGGVLRHGSRLMTDAVCARVPEAVPLRAEREPAVAALLWAYDAAGIGPDLARLHDTVPGAETFATTA
jgi:N-acetylglucosamine kinase-like BadF-type ATPase